MDAVVVDDRPVDLTGPDDPPPASKKPRRPRKKRTPDSEWVELVGLDSSSKAEAEFKLWKKKVGYLFKLGLISAVALTCLAILLFKDGEGSQTVVAWSVLGVLPMFYFAID